jgi:hypothetical protein
VNIIQSKGDGMMEDIKQVVKISTDETLTSQKCVVCAIPVGLDRLEKSINHYIQEHGYKLLHVGTETAKSNEGNGLYYSTVAILGKS